MRWLLLLVLLAGDEIDDWIARLGDADVSARDAATEKLIGAGRPAAPRVRKLLEAGDPELKARARDILARMTPEYEVAYDVDGRERCAFSPDGRFLAWWDKERCLQIAWARTGQGRRAYEAAVAGPARWDTRFIRGVPAWLGGRVLADLGGQLLQSFDPEKAGAGERFATIGKRLESFTPLASGDALLEDDASLKIYYAKTSKTYGLPLATRGVISADGSRIIGADADGRVTLHAGAGSWKTRHIVKTGVASRWIVATPDLSRVYVAGPTSLSELDAASLTVKPGPELKAGDVLRCLTMRADGAWLLSARAGKRIDIQLADTLRTIASIDLDEMPDHVAVTADGAMMAVVLESKTVVYRRRD